MSEYEQRFSNTPGLFGIGVNAKNARRRVRSKSLSTVGQARVLAGFAAGMEKRLAAISQLHPQLDQEDIERIQKVDSHVQSLARSYISTGKLPDWSKDLSKDIKQFFRLHQLLSQPESQIITIRLGHGVAAAALSAPRGPADYLAGLITRVLKALGISTELVFNLEFVHGACRENHPLHIHGALCIPDDQIGAVIESLRQTLAPDYRARYTNYAVLLEEPLSACFWASYCIKESAVTSQILSDLSIRKNSPSYSNRARTRSGKAFYERIEGWFSEGQTAV